MILVNFLPKELQPKIVKPQRTINLPIIPVAVAVFSVFMVIALYNLLVASRVGMEKRKLQGEWEDLKAPSAEAERLQQQMKSGVAEEAVFFDRFLKTPIEMGQILNIVSDTLPRSIWLTDLSCDWQKGQIKLVLNGYSEAAVRDTKLVEIQNYATAVKDQLETLLRPKPKQENAAGNASALPEPKVKMATVQQKPILTSAVTTSSKRGTAAEGSEGGSLTQFTITIQNEDAEKSNG